MKKVWVTMEPITEGEKKGWFSPTGFHTKEPEKWYSCYTVADPEEFIAHMKKYQALPTNPLSREEYERLCAENDVVPCADEALDSYGMEYGDFGMSHYHTEPANRKTGITNTIHQLRYRAIHNELKQRKQQAAKPVPVPDYPEGKKLACGHVVYYTIQVMSASLGSSCADCYDRMSD